MKTLLTGAALAFALASPVLADPIVGTWHAAPKDAEGSLYVKIAPCGGSYCGTIVKAFDANGAIGDYEHQGKTMIRNMEAKGNNRYSGGTIWAPDTDKTYRSKMEINGNVLRVRGCVAGGAICRDAGSWKRVN